jgi:hypothetical protein
MKINLGYIELETLRDLVAESDGYNDGSHVENMLMNILEDAMKQYRTELQADADYENFKDSMPQNGD